MKITPGSTGVRLPINVFTGSAGTEIVVADVSSAAVEVWQNGSLVSTTALTLALVEDDTWAAGNIEHVGDGLHYVSIPDAAVATGGVTVIVVIASSSQTTFGSEVEVEATAPTAAQNAAAILAAGDVDGFSLEETLKLCLAVLAGKVSGGDGTTITIRAADDSKTRITATVDVNGNRSALTLDAS